MSIDLRDSELTADSVPAVPAGQETDISQLWYHASNSGSLSPHRWEEIVFSWCNAAFEPLQGAERLPFIDECHNGYAMIATRTNTHTRQEADEEGKVVSAPHEKERMPGRSSRLTRTAHRWPAGAPERRHPAVLFEGDVKRCWSSPRSRRSTPPAFRSRSTRREPRHRVQDYRGEHRTRDLLAQSQSLTRELQKQQANQADQRPPRQQPKIAEVREPC